MERSRTLYKVINPLFPFSDYLYILQLEEYESARLLRWLPRFFFRRNIQKRQKLVLTKRAVITIGLSILLWNLGSVIQVVLVELLPLRVFVVLFNLLLIPLYVYIGNLILAPYFNFIRKSIRKSAIEKVKNHEDLRIVAVAGSYGKTTVKNFIYQLVRYNYKTQMIPGNINTPAGIASWVNQYLESSTQLLVMEVDTYRIGEITESLEITPPDISVLTNIGDQHLERFGSSEELTQALLEVYTPGDKKPEMITVRSQKESLSSFDEYDNIRFVSTCSDDVELSESNRVNLALALEVAQILQIPKNFINDSIVKLELPERRQNFTHMFGFDAIDDSYNISLTTAKSGLLAARNKATEINKQLLVITAGIPELGENNLDGNITLGKLIGDYAEEVIILKSVFAEDIEQGIDGKVNHKTIKDLETMLETELDKYDPQQWMLLIQPELGDLYY